MLRSFRRLFWAALMVVPLVLCSAPASLIGHDQQIRGLQQHRLAKIHTWLLAQDGAAETQLLAQSVVRESQRYSLDPALILAVIHVESRFDPVALSPRGAQGLMQIKNVAVTELIDEGKLPARRHDLEDPAVNVHIGVSYLVHLIEMFGDLHTALAAYNSGPTRVRGKLAANEPIPSDYAEKVLGTRHSVKTELAQIEVDLNSIGKAA